VSSRPQAPGPGDASVDNTEEVHLGYVEEAAPGCRMTEPGAGVCSRTGESAHDGFALGNKLNDAHVYLGE